MFIFSENLTCFIFLIPPFMRLAFLHYCRQVEYFKTFPFNPFLSKHVDIFFPKSFILDPFQTILVHGSRTKYLSNIPFCCNDRNDFDLPVQFNVSGKNSFDFKFSISRTIFWERTKKLNHVLLKIMTPFSEKGSRYIPRLT